MHDHVFTALGLQRWESKITPKKDLMLIYDAADFDDNADNLLTAMLKAINISRNQIHEIVYSSSLNEQIVSLQPTLLMTMGDVAAHHLLGTTSPLESLRDKIHVHGDIPLIATYHPAYLFQNPADKRKAFNDLLLIQRTLRDLTNGLSNASEQTLSNSST